MRKRSKIPFLVMSGAAIIALSFTAYSTYLLVNGEASSSFPASKTKERVCYITSDGGATKTYYTDIGKAISVSKSSETIVVLPHVDKDGTYDMVIDGQYASNGKLTIPEGVTLSLPYQVSSDGLDTPVANSKVAAKQTSTHAFRDTTGKLMKSLVEIAEGITLENRGTIEIGGLLGAGGGGQTSGATYADYAALSLREGASLVSYGLINAYGLITEETEGTATVVLEPTAELWLPMCWNDFGGGSALTGIYKGIESHGTQCLPLDDFYFENVEPLIRIKGGAEVSSWVNIYITLLQKFDASPFAEYDMKIIGAQGDSSAIVSIPEGSYLETDYSYEKRTYQQAAVDGVTPLPAEGSVPDPRHELDFYGDATFNALAINVEQAAHDAGAGDLYNAGAGIVGIPEVVSTDEGYFPISHVFHISLNPLPGQSSAHFDGSRTRYKLMSGSSLEIKEGARLDVLSLVAYDGTDYLTERSGSVLGTNGSVMPKSGDWKKWVKVPAEAVVNGTLSAGTAAGSFETTATGARLSALSSTNVTMQEPLSVNSNDVTIPILNITIPRPELGSSKSMPLNLELRESDMSFTDRGTGDYDSFYLPGYEHGFWPDPLVISCSGGNKTAPGSSGTFSLSAASGFDGMVPAGASLRYDWNVPEGCSVISSGARGETASVTIPANFSSGSDISYTITCRAVLSSGEGAISLSSTYNLLSAPVEVKVTYDPANTNPGESNPSWSLGTNWNYDFSDWNSFASSYSISGDLQDYASYAWKHDDKTGASVGSSVDLSDAGSPTPKLSMNKGTTSISTDVSASITINIPGKPSFSLATDTVTFHASGCLSGDTVIYMADGERKRLRDIRKGDKALSFDHERGRLVERAVILLIRRHSQVDRLVMEFEDGTRLVALQSHALFDLDKSKYAYINSENGVAFVGHHFAAIRNGSVVPLRMVSFHAERSAEDLYDIVTEGTLNYFAEGVLSITSDLAITQNAFRFREGIACFDMEARAEDIRRHGLWRAEEWSSLIDKEGFAAFAIAYMKVGASKGLYPRSFIEGLIDDFV